MEKKDRLIPSDQMKEVVYTCGITGCDWTRNNLEMWEALREYRIHFITFHPNESYTSASLGKSEINR